MTRVRTARADDGAAIDAVHTAAVEAFGPDAYDEEQVAAWAGYQGSDGPTLDDDQHWVVAERDGDVVGWGSVDVDESEITGVYVHPGHARRGIGTAVLAHLEGYALAAGCEVVTLVASLNAVPFYERAGYRVRTHHEETPSGLDMRVAEMAKTL